MKTSPTRTRARLAVMTLLIGLSSLISFSQRSIAHADGTLNDWERTPVWATATAVALKAQGTLIALNAPGAPAEAWTVVQWQDGQGRWQDVSGWQGALDADGRKSWGVAPETLSVGLFRWVVYFRRGGAAWAVSPAFTLPAQRGAQLMVTARPANAASPGWSVTTARAGHDGVGLRLITSDAPAEAWTVVQWQDGQGRWQDVSGWQGALDADGRKNWWAAPEALGAGPFRWVIYFRRGGAAWAVSPAFTLPAARGNDTLIEMTAAP